MERRLAILNNAKDGKFPWQRFNEVFPHALMDESEGEFDIVLSKASALCSNSDKNNNSLFASENKTLLDLVDLQLIATLEQLDAQKTFLEIGNDEVWDNLCFEIERIAAKIQLVENHRTTSATFGTDKEGFWLSKYLSRTTTRQVIFKPSGSIIDRLYAELRARTFHPASKK